MAATRWTLTLDTTPEVRPTAAGPHIEGTFTYGPLKITLIADFGHGRLRPMVLVLTPATSGELPLTGLRRAPVPEMLEHLRTALATNSVVLADSPPDGQSDLVESWWSTVRPGLVNAELPTRPPDGVRRTDGYLALLADTYQARVDAGDRKPIASIATEVGLTREQIRDDVMAARKAAWLSSPGKGRAVGAVTKKLAGWRAKRRENEIRGQVVDE